MRAYREAVAYVQDRLRGYCNARGAEYVLIKDDKPLDEIFFEKFTEMGVLK